MRQQQQPSEAAMLSILACTVVTNFACMRFFPPGVVTRELTTLCQVAKGPNEPGLDDVHSLPADANKDARQTQEV